MSKSGLVKLIATLFLVSSIAGGGYLVGKGKIKNPFKANQPQKEIVIHEFSEGNPIEFSSTTQAYDSLNPNYTPLETNIEVGYNFRKTNNTVTFDYYANQGTLQDHERLPFNYTTPNEDSANTHLYLIHPADIEIPLLTQIVDSKSKQDGKINSQLLKPPYETNAYRGAFNILNFLQEHNKGMPDIAGQMFKDSDGNAYEQLLDYSIGKTPKGLQQGLFIVKRGTKFVLTKVENKRQQDLLELTDKNYKITKIPIFQSDNPLTQGIITKRTTQLIFDTNNIDQPTPIYFAIDGPNFFWGENNTKRAGLDGIVATTYIFEPIKFQESKNAIGLWEWEMPRKTKSRFLGTRNSRKFSYISKDGIFYFANIEENGDDNLIRFMKQKNVTKNGQLTLFTVEDDDDRSERVIISRIGKDVFDFYGIVPSSDIDKNIQEIQSKGYLGKEQPQRGRRIPSQSKQQEVINMCEGFRYTENKIENIVNKFYQKGLWESHIKKLIIERYGNKQIIDGNLSLFIEKGILQPEDIFDYWGSEIVFKLHPTFDGTGVHIRSSGRDKIFETEDDFRRFVK